MNLNKNKSGKLSVLLIIALLMASLTGCGNNAGTVEQINLMSWGGDFIPREVISEFEEETGIKVNYKEVTSNEDMQSLLEANPDQYDLAVVTDYMVDILR
ncbi:MAG: spermidine/putrescine ABC transporter substrate-binding protein, partial [Sedimentibacter sp.]